LGRKGKEKQKKKNLHAIKVETKTESFPLRKRLRGKEGEEIRLWKRKAQKKGEKFMLVTGKEKGGGRGGGEKSPLLRNLRGGKKTE